MSKDLSSRTKADSRLCLRSIRATEESISYNIAGKHRGAVDTGKHRGAVDTQTQPGNPNTRRPLFRPRTGPEARGQKSRDVVPDSEACVVSDSEACV